MRIKVRQRESLRGFIDILALLHAGLEDDCHDSHEMLWTHIILPFSNPGYTNAARLVPGPNIRRTLEYDPIFFLGFHGKHAPTLKDTNAEFSFLQVVRLFS